MTMIPAPNTEAADPVATVQEEAVLVDREEA